MPARNALETAPFAVGKRSERARGKPLNEQHTKAMLNCRSTDTLRSCAPFLVISET